MVFMHYMIRYSFLLLLLAGISSCIRIDLPLPDQEGIPFGVSGLKDGEGFYVGLDSLNALISTGSTYFGDGIITLEGGIHRFSPSDYSLEISLRGPHYGVFDTAYWLSPREMQVRTFGAGLEQIYPCTVNIVNTFSQENRFEGLTTTISPGDWGTITVPSFVLGLEGGVAYRYTTEYETAEGSGSYDVVYGGAYSWPAYVFWVAETNIPRPGYARLSAFSTLENIGPVIYKWSTGQTAPYIDVTQPGLYSVTATDVNGTKVFSSKELKSDGGECVFSLVLTHIDVDYSNGYNDTLGLGTAEVRLKGPDGTLYSSLLAKSNSPASFIIDEAQIMTKASNIGFDLLACRVRFSCIVADQAGNEIFLQNMEGWMPVGLPPE